MKAISNLLISLLVISSACSKTHDCTRQDSDTTNQNNGGLHDADNDCTEWVDAILENKAGLDGCGWVLRINGGTYLEPTNLMDFEIDLVNGKLVSINYEELKNMASICMIGKIVELKCIKE